MHFWRKFAEGAHKKIIRQAAVLLRKHFGDDSNVEGYLKNGPVATMKFEMGDDGPRENRILRQREASDIVMRFLDVLD